MANEVRVLGLWRVILISAGNARVDHRNHSGQQAIVIHCGGLARRNGTMGSLVTRGEEECPESESDVKNSYVVIYSGSFFILLLLQHYNYHYSMVSSWMAQKTTSSTGTTMIDT